MVEGLVVGHALRRPPWSLASPVQVSPQPRSRVGVDISIRLGGVTHAVVLLPALDLEVDPMDEIGRRCMTLAGIDEFANVGAFALQSPFGRSHVQTGVAPATTTALATFF